MLTEPDWLLTRDLDLVVRYLTVWANARKNRLFACACFRFCWPILLERGEKLRAWYAEMNHWIPDALTASESFADRRISKKELRGARKPSGRYGITGGPYNIGLNVSRTDDRSVILVPRSLRSVFHEEKLADPTETFVTLARDIFGNPFRPVALDPAWLAWNNGTVVSLAKTIYEDRRWDLMPILGDALEDAMCDNAAILEHCRGPGPHVRGCWVVDLIFGKS